MLDARVELFAQLLGIYACRRADGYNLRARRALAPLVQFRDFGATSHHLEGKTLVRGVRSENDPLTAVNGRRCAGGRRNAGPPLKKSPPGKARGP